MRQIGTGSWLVIVTGLCVLGACAGQVRSASSSDSTKDCAEMLLQRDIQTVAKTREQRFLGKVPDTTARCLGGKHAESLREGPWLDWPNYWAAGDATSRAPARLLANAKVIGPNAHGINGALYELELQRIELIKFNLFDNNKTYEAYVTGRDGEAGPVLNTWPEMRLPAEPSRLQGCRWRPDAGLSRRVDSLPHLDRHLQRHPQSADGIDASTLCAERRVQHHVSRSGSE